MSVNTTSLNSFNSNHELYDKVRPDFTDESVEVLEKGLLLQPGSKVVELASGTGKFTKSIVNKGYDITAVEPSSGMNVSFKKNFPDIPLKEGSSYDIPLPDGSADAVIIAQAFHWFADHKSLKEIARVLKPGGRLGLIWNFDDSANLPEGNWQRKIAELAWGFDGVVPQYRHGKWQESFENQNYFKVPYNEERIHYTRLVPAKKEFVWGYWLSRSYITSLPEDKKEDLKNLVYKTFTESVKESDIVEGDKLSGAGGVHVVWAERI